LRVACSLAALLAGCPARWVAREGMACGRVACG